MHHLTLWEYEEEHHPRRGEGDRGSADSAGDVDNNAEVIKGESDESGEGDEDDRGDQVDGVELEAGKALLEGGLLVVLLWLAWKGGLRQSRVLVETAFYHLKEGGGRDAKGDGLDGVGEDDHEREADAGGVDKSVVGIRVEDVRGHLIAISAVAAAGHDTVHDPGEAEGENVDDEHASRRRPLHLVPDGGRGDLALVGHCE
mmetsp:Transcript_5728/g.12527  ORF Transcript_5728/g.12527 Transcript_5728/m.12527 type:complete len:201 (-) Transcript_5728:141-743(-)